MKKKIFCEFVFSKIFSIFDLINAEALIENSSKT